MARDFNVLIPARFLKDDSLSSDARILRAVIGAYADGETGMSYVTGKKLQAILGWGRQRRENAQRELHQKGWLRLDWKRGERAKFARRIYALADPAHTVAQSERSGKPEQLISYHSQSQVRSSIPTNLTESNPESTESIKE
jgi:hypothetical protein